MLPQNLVWRQLIVDTIYVHEPYKEPKLTKEAVSFDSGEPFHLLSSVSRSLRMADDNLRMLLETDSEALIAILQNDPGAHRIMVEAAIEDIRQALTTLNRLRNSN